MVRLNGLAQEGLRDEVASNPLWYHTLELPSGILTPGWFDLRPVLSTLPFPDVRGKRCLDVGTYDGFFAFEMERRGAREVVATDVADHTGWDWRADRRELGPERLAAIAGPQKGLGFDIASRALSSNVTRVELSVYELSPEVLGRFEVIVCGSLLLHLKSPVMALEAIRSVCDGVFLSAEQIDLGLSLLRPRSGAARFEEGTRLQWWIMNAAGHSSLLRSAGWRPLRKARPYSIPFGAGHRALGEGWGPAAHRGLQRLLTGAVGVPHSAVLASRD